MRDAWLWYRIKVCILRIGNVISRAPKAHAALGVGLRGLEAGLELEILRMQ